MKRRITGEWSEVNAKRWMNGSPFSSLPTKIGIPFEKAFFSSSQRSCNLIDVGEDLVDLVLAGDVPKDQEAVEIQKRLLHRSDRLAQLKPGGQRQAPGLLDIRLGRESGSGVTG